MLNFLDTDFTSSDYSDPNAYALMLPSAMKPWGARGGGLNLWPTNWNAGGRPWMNQNYLDDLEHMAMEPLADAGTAAQSTMNVRLDKDSNTYIVEVSLPRLCAVDFNKALLASESDWKLRAGAHTRCSPRGHERGSGRRQEARSDCEAGKRKEGRR